MRADLVRVRSGQQPLAPVVMSEDERTALLNPRSTGQTRRINGAGTRYGPPVPPARYDTGDHDGEPERGSGRRIALGVAAVVVAALIGLTGYLIWGGSPSTPQVRVPDVSGQQPEAARSTLQDAKLLVTVERVPSSSEQRDRVVDTDPRAGTEVAEGSTVRLQVGSGPDQTAVPPLTGRTVAEAGPLLSDRGLVLGAQTEQNTTDPAQVGKILSSSPAAGENVPGGTAVAVTVGRQPSTVTVPDVRGDADDAERQLRQAGFTVARTTVDAGGTEGDVVGTNPPAGTQAAAGSTVTLQIASGESGDTDMPNVVGDSEGAAQRTLAQAGLAVTVQRQPVTDEDDDGRVIRQNPDRGTSVQPGDRATIVVGQLSGGSGGGNSGDTSTPETSGGN
jgi:serine/threonine-protein kinase